MKHWKLSLLIALCAFAPVRAGELDPKALSFKMPDKIEWKGNSAVLFGDPNKEGSLYGVLTRWTPHNNSRPHFHQNDRYIYVISGTWWVGTGPKFDADSMVPMKAGTYVTHYAKGIHYDGAKDEPALLEIVGIGPAASTNAEEK